MHKEQQLDPTKLSHEHAKILLGYAIDARKSEIDRLWSRSLVFWGLVAASFVAFATLFKDAQYTAPEFAIACFGLICSFAWKLQNRGSKYWQEAWESKVAVLEALAFQSNIFSNREPLQEKGWWGAGRWSVSKLIVAVSDLAVVVWIGLITVSWSSDKSWITNVIHSSFPLRSWALIATIVYAIIIFFLGRTGE